MSSRKGPIIIVEDDADDREILAEVLYDLDLENEVKFFTCCQDVITYLMDTSDKPLMILSDINLPVMNGLEMRQSINENDYLRKKSIPFIFLSTSGKKESVDKAYELMVQGYFQKPNSLKELKDTLLMVINYWKVCLHPNAG